MGSDGDSFVGRGNIEKYVISRLFVAVLRRW